MTTFFAILACGVFCSRSMWLWLVLLAAIACVQSWSKSVMNRQLREGLSMGFPHDVARDRISDRVTILNMASSAVALVLIGYAAALYLRGH